jgi:predicted ATP-dependent serine protease
MESVAKISKPKSKSILFEDVVVYSEPAVKTGKVRFDEWFSADGGIVNGSAIYVSGTSGAGKTTLMVNLMKWLSPRKVSMYLREMEGRNVKAQTKNIKIPKGSAYISDGNTCSNFGEYMEELEELKPEFVIVDSLQVVAKEDFEMNGLMSEDDACYHIIKTLREWCSKNNSTLFLIGHNTKDGNFAGRNTLIQMMDAHIVMEHDKKNDCRKISWGQKNRKGPMGMLYYTFGKYGIEFHTEGEWESITNQKNDKHYELIIVEQTEMYINSLDSKKQEVKDLKKEYKKQVKNICKIECQTEFISEYVNFVSTLLQNI